VETLLAEIDHLLLVAEIALIFKAAIEFPTIRETIIEINPPLRLNPLN